MIFDHSDEPGWPAEPTRVYVETNPVPFDHSWETTDRELSFATTAGLRLANRNAKYMRRWRRARKAAA